MRAPGAEGSTEVGLETGEPLRFSTVRGSC